MGRLKVEIWHKEIVVKVASATLLKNGTVKNTFSDIISSMT